jgi:hypothetical protein
MSGSGFHVHGPHDHGLEKAAEHGNLVSMCWAHSPHRNAQIYARRGVKPLRPSMRALRKYFCFSLFTYTSAMGATKLAIRCNTYMPIRTGDMSKARTAKAQLVWQ